jgi:hypothetical protein
LRELIDRGDVDRVNRRFLTHTFLYHSVNTILVLTVSTNKQVVNWSVPFLQASQKALAEGRGSTWIVWEDFKMDDFQHGFSIEFILDFIISVSK